jgi:hypothetical protein
MSLVFRYRRFHFGQSQFTLDGLLYRPKPVLAVSLVGPTATVCVDALVDGGSDDTLFPIAVAQNAGIDLRQARQGTLTSAGGTAVSVRYLQVTLRLATRQEQREWQAWVGFTIAPLPRPLLGYAGFLRFFTAIFHGEKEEVELTVNGLYAGT